MSLKDYEQFKFSLIDSIKGDKSEIIKNWFSNKPENELVLILGDQTQHKNGEKLYFIVTDNISIDNLDLKFNPVTLYKNYDKNGVVIIGKNNAILASQDLIKNFHIKLMENA
jgi:hypothetical protein